MPGNSHIHSVRWPRHGPGKPPPAGQPTASSTLLMLARSCGSLFCRMSSPMSSTACNLVLRSAKGSAARKLPMSVMAVLTAASWVSHVPCAAGAPSMGRRRQAVRCRGNGDSALNEAWASRPSTGRNPLLAPAPCSTHRKTGGHVSHGGEVSNHIGVSYTTRRPTAEWVTYRALSGRRRRGPTAARGQPEVEGSLSYLKPSMPPKNSLRRTQRQAPSRSPDRLELVFDALCSSGSW